MSKKKEKENKSNLNTTEKNDNNLDTLEILIKNELDKRKISEEKRENLKDINLLENNSSYLYNWQNLFNISIPLDRYINSQKEASIDTSKINNDQKENNINLNLIFQEINNAQNENKNKAKFNSTYKRNKKNKLYRSNSNIDIDYENGINVISQLPNQSLQNYYSEIIKKRLEEPGLGPRLKLNNNHLKKEIKSQRFIVFNKEKKLNKLSSKNESEENIKKEDLIISVKRKNADILAENFYGEELEKIKNKKKIKNKYNRNIFRKQIMKLKKNKSQKNGLVLSVYEENNPFLKIFKDAEKNLSEQNKNKKKNKIDTTGEEIIKPTLKRNLFSASNLPLSDNIVNINDKNHKFDDNDNQKSYRNENNRKIIYINDKNTQINFSDSNTIFIEDPNNRLLHTLKRPMSSLNLKYSIPQIKLFNSLNNNILRNNNINTISYRQSFPMKKSSKVGNVSYDKINKILKYKLYKKNLKLKSKKNYMNLDSYDIDNNNAFSEDKIENIKQKFDNNNYRVFSNGYFGNINYYFFGDDYKYENIKNKIKIYDDENILKNIRRQVYKYPLTIHNKNRNNFYSCSNNCIVNNKRKNKNKFLNNYSNNSSLNEFLSEILYEDKLIQGESSDRIKSVYNLYK